MQRALASTFPSPRFSVCYHLGVEKRATNQKLAPWCRHDKDGKENRADENEHAFGSVTSVERQVRFQLQTVSVCMSVLSSALHTVVRSARGVVLSSRVSPSVEEATRKLLARIAGRGR